MESNKTAQTMTLRDGRVLGFAEYGEPKGTPIFYFTGGNSSRLEGAWFDDVARKRNVRLIVPDRPGFGLSDYHPNRTLLDWVDDVAELVDALGISQFAVFGLSGGGPHTAAVIYKMSDLLTGAAIVSSPCPYGMPGMFEDIWAPLRMMYFLANRAPLWINERIQGFMSNPDNLIKNKDRLSPPDTAILTTRPELAEQFRASMIESVCNGTRGAGQEWQMYTRPWGFPLDNISMEVHLWYGEVDVNAPPAMGRNLAQLIPNSQLHILPDEAHFSLINNHIEAILANLGA